MTDPSPPGDVFREAVAAIDAGDLATLRRILAACPNVAAERLDGPAPWLRAEIGNALDGFFARPYLLWFVAEDPARRGRLPDNIVPIAAAIIEAARISGPETLQEQLDYALRLVAWSGVAAARDVQIPLIDLLVDAGASPLDEVNNALVNGHTRAAEHLLERGGRLTFAAAVCLGRWGEMDRMAPGATPAQRSFALVLAALNGETESVRRMLALGVDVNQPSDALYAHGTPLHHAVCSGSIDAVRTLVEAGADVHRLDTVWNGTPLGWAEYYVDTVEPERKARYAEIAAWLRSVMH
jgi:peptide-methionine (S)-S-oxide reductase